MLVCEVSLSVSIVCYMFPIHSARAILCSSFMFQFVDVNIFSFSGFNGPKELYI
jgi:di/tricarboxylate transporter